MFLNVQLFFLQSKRFLFNSRLSCPTLWSASSGLSRRRLLTRLLKLAWLTIKFFSKALEMLLSGILEKDSSDSSWLLFLWLSDYGCQSVYVPRKFLCKYFSSALFISDVICYLLHEEQVSGLLFSTLYFKCYLLFTSWRTSAGTSLQHSLFQMLFVIYFMKNKCRDFSSALFISDVICYLLYKEQVLFSTLYFRCYLLFTSWRTSVRPSLQHSLFQMLFVIYFIKNKCRDFSSAFFISDVICYLFYKEQVLGLLFSTIYFRCYLLFILQRTTAGTFLQHSLFQMLFVIYSSKNKCRDFSSALFISDVICYLCYKEQVPGLLFSTLYFRCYLLFTL